MAERPKLGQLLLGAEVIAEGQLAAALDEQKQTGRPLGMTLVKMGFLDEETLVRTLARQMSLPVAWIRGKKIRKPVLELVPPQIVGAHRCLPVRVDDQEGSKTLLLAMEDPADLAVLDEVALAAGMPVRPVLAAPSEIEESIGRHYPDIELAPSIGDVELVDSFDQELIPGLESATPHEVEDEDKDDACMSSLERDDELPDLETGQVATGAGPALDYDDLDDANSLELDPDDSGSDLELVDPGDSGALALESDDPSTLEPGDVADSSASLKASGESDSAALSDGPAETAGEMDDFEFSDSLEDESGLDSFGDLEPVGGSTPAAGGATQPAAAQESDTPEPDLVHLSDSSPLAEAARSRPQGALGSVGADVILRALSQLLVEKGVIGREELIARLAKLAGSGEGLPEDLEAEI